MRIRHPRRAVAIPEAEAPRDCPLCPRLVAFREECRAEHPDWWNAPVPAFGDRRGVACHRRPCAGQAWREPHRPPFTGDYAGELLIRDALKFGLAEGQYRRSPRTGCS